MDEAIAELKKIASSAPASPGVYLWKDENKTILYIGKALSLKSRLASYFLAKSPYKVRFILKNSRTIEWIQTQNEYDALLLENNLIKQYSPRYNVNLKDGKTYPAIKVTKDEYPRILRTRTIIQDGSTYYGPFPSADIIDRYLRIIQQLFPLRRCRVMKKRENPCLYYHIGKCSAPCAGKIDKTAYLHHIEQAKLLLEGKTEELILNLKKKMHGEAELFNFEKAAYYRDLIQTLEVFHAENPFTDFTADDHDIIAWHNDGSLCTIVCFQFRNGKMINRDLYRELYAGNPEEAILEFMLSYYKNGNQPPPTIIMRNLPDTDLLIRYFSEAFKVSIALRVPATSREESATSLAEFNAVEDIKKRRKEAGFFEGVAGLQKVLDLPKLPELIVCFDIAQLGGKHTVASAVQFVNGIPDKRGYRLYKMRSLQGKIDDFESIREAVARHTTKILNGEEEVMPDLFVIDGGIGQVHAALGILDSLQASVPVIGLAKEHETIILPDAGSIQLEPNHPALQLLVAMRDEAHRFATKTNQNMRKKAAAASVFTEIQGIGPKKSAAILTRFKTLDQIAEAEPEYLKEFLHISENQALEIRTKAQSMLNRETKDTAATHDNASSS